MQGKVCPLGSTGKVTLSFHVKMIEGEIQMCYDENMEQSCYRVA